MNALDLKLCVIKNMLYKYMPFNRIYHTHRQLLTGNINIEGENQNVHFAVKGHL